MLAVGCTPEPMGAPAGSELTLIGEGIGVVETQQVVAADGMGILRTFQAYVEGPPDENDISYPLNNTQVEVLSTWYGAYVVAEGAVKMVDEFSDRCEELEAEGAVEAECAVWYNVDGEQYVEFAGEYQSADEFSPTYMSGVTDGRGVMSFYVFIDSVPFDENGEVLDFSVYGTIGVDDASVEMSLDI
jgi:hypothetical protein